MDGTLKLGLIFIFSVSLFGCGQGSSSAVSSSQKDIFNEETAQAIGFYSNGSLLDPVQLPPESAAHLKIFRARDRAWGTQSLVSTILRATSAFHAHFPHGDRVQIGDMAQHSGGFLTMHDSHQNGLDADVAYLKSNQDERDPEGTGPKGFEENFVKHGQVTSNFDVSRNWFLLKEIVARGTVSRIFVDPAIKKEFCAKSLKIDPKEDAAVRVEVLRRLRPYPNHADHFHMRVSCPPSNGRCISQEEPPEGSGCNSTRALEVSTSEHDA